MSVSVWVIQNGMLLSMLSLYKVEDRIFALCGVGTFDPRCGVYTLLLIFSLMEHGLYHTIVLLRWKDPVLTSRALLSRDTKSSLTSRDIMRRRSTLVSRPSISCTYVCWQGDTVGLTGRANLRPATHYQTWDEFSHGTNQSEHPVCCFKAIYINCTEADAWDWKFNFVSYVYVHCTLRC